MFTSFFAKRAEPMPPFAVCDLYNCGYGDMVGRALGRDIQVLRRSEEDIVSKAGVVTILVVPNESRMGVTGDRIVRQCKEVHGKKGAVVVVVFQSPYETASYSNRLQGCAFENRYEDHIPVLQYRDDAQNIDGEPIKQAIRSAAKKAGIETEKGPGFFARIARVALPILGSLIFVASIGVAYTFSVSLLGIGLGAVALASLLIATGQLGNRNNDALASLG